MSLEYWNIISKIYHENEKMNNNNIENFHSGLSLKEMLQICLRNEVTANQSVVNFSYTLIMKVME